MPDATKSALQNARDGFLAGLARRGEALRPVVHRFIANPTGRVVRAELQRRLHSLLASAQLFEEPALVAQLQHLTGRLDAVGLGGELWQKSDGELLLALLESLCAADTGTSAPPLSAAGAYVQPSSRESAPLAEAPGGLGAVLLVRVLLVCSRPHAAALRGLLDEAPVELIHAADPELALALLDQYAPACALIAAEFATLPDIDLVRRLRADAAQPVEAVFLLLPEGATYDAEFVRQTGADGVLIEPISWEMLGPLLERAALPVQSSASVIDEAAGAVVERAASIARRARSVRSAELSLSARETIERVRSYLAEQSRAAAATASATSENGSSSSVRERTLLPRPRAQRTRSLSGRRVLVVDDDAAMLWFFSGVIRDAGAEVLQARDGVEAIELARRKRPQLVLSDILMPKLDGFALRRALRQSLTLERVPVLLLSWKGDPVDAGAASQDEADGLLRKEASVAEVLTAIERALLPRQQLEAALRTDAVVSGRVEQHGIVELIDMVVSLRPDVSIVVEDATDLFELDIADATHVAATRTASDGSFTRAQSAIVQLLGVTEGQFQVRTRAGSLRNPMAEGLSGALSAALSDMSGVLAAVDDDHIERVAKLALDEDLLQPLLKDAPAYERVVALLRGVGFEPKRWLQAGAWGRAELLGCLRHLARRGAILGAWAADGESLLPDGWQAHVDRITDAAASLSVHASPAASALDGAAPAQACGADGSQQPAIELEQAAADAGSPLAEHAKPRDAAPDASAGLADGDGYDNAAASSGTAEQQALASAAAGASTEPGGGDAASPGIEPESDADAPVPEWLLALASSSAPHLHSEPLAAPAARTESRSAPDAASAAPVGLVDASIDLRTLEPPVADAAIARRRRREGAQLIATLAACSALGYVGALQLETHPVLLGHVRQVSGTRGLSLPLMAAVQGRETSVRSGLDPAAGLGTVLPYIDTTRGVPVGSDEGLVIFEYVGPTPLPNVEIDGRLLGSPPLAVALPAKPHLLKLRFAGDAILRTLSVRAGETRVITLPLSQP